ncbi:MFS transporter [Luteimonas sp. MJ293]|uniref:MFS transporter n=1 Tax=Luteimonas sp. MJ146 TaxID=3129240 RepID=UPI0031BAE1F9
MTPVPGAPRLRAPEWFVFGLMASVTFVGLLSELIPSGILPQMTEDLGVSESHIGMLVGVYALASAVGTIPLVTATLTVNRKHLLLVLLAGFAISNLVVGLASSYAVMVGARIVGGVCAGVMWPMIAAYGTRLVPPERQGWAITVILAGSTLGISVGLPVMTLVGLEFGWRTEFLVFGLGVVVIAALCHLYLPAVPGEQRSRSNSPLTLLKNRAILMVILLTFLSVTGHYAVYTYIALLVETVQLAGGTGMALLVFGIGSVISVVASARVIDRWLQALVVSMLVLSAVSMLLFLAFARTPGIAHFTFFLWGVSFGPLGAMYQTAIARQVDRGRDVATSLQSSVFNFSIMLAAGLGGVLLVRLAGAGVKGIVWLALACFVLGAIVALMAKQTLRRA